MKKLHTRATTDLSAKAIDAHQAQYLTKKNHTSRVMPALILALIHGIASAEGWYGSVQYDSKEKVYSNGTSASKNYGQINAATQVTIGKKLDNWYVETDFASEVADYRSTTGPSYSESLYQIGVGRRFPINESIFDIFTPYVKLSAGNKNKFDPTKGVVPVPFYRYDLGTNIKLTDDFGLKLNWRHRQAFSDTVMTAVSDYSTNYKTNETSLSLNYRFTPSDSISIGKSAERADVSGNTSTEYNHIVVQYTKNF